MIEAVRTHARRGTGLLIKAGLFLTVVYGIIQAEGRIRLALLSTPTEKIIRWDGASGKTYFIQWSTDLKNWSFFPVIYSGDGSSISHGFNSTSDQFYTRLKWTDLPDGGDPHAQDFDKDGLSSIEELTSPFQTDPLEEDTDGDQLLDGWEIQHGYIPNDPDSDGNGTFDGLEDPDGDGANNLAEQGNEGNPHDAIDQGLPPLEVLGDGGQGEERLASRSYLLPAGSRDYVVLAHVHSEEYPEYTSVQSIFDDVFRWKIEPSIGDAIEGSVSVNSLHEQWVDSEAEGSSFMGYSPIASKVLGVVHASPTEDITVDVELGMTNISDGELWSVAMVSLVPVAMTPDWNRDGIIDHKDQGKVSEANPWRWWMNDDDDNPDVAGVTDGSGDTPTGGFGDSHDNRVDGVRDLVDFFPLHLDLKDLLRRFPADKHSYRLKQEDAALKFVEVPFANARAGRGAASHLIHVGTASSLSRSLVKRTKEDGLLSNGGRLSDDYLKAVAGGRGMVLCEGSNTSDKPLRLEIWTKKGDNLRFSIEMPLRISRVEEMYRHANLRDQLPKEGGEEVDAGQLPSQMENPGEAYPDSLTNGKYFVFVHGYNVDAYNARGWHAEIFKRMHQLGSRARFVGVSWHGDTGLDYHHAVHHAFQTGDIFKDHLPSGEGVTIAAHSLGNMVVSQAIEYGSYAPKRYYMINAATPIEAYDTTQTTGNDGRNMEEFMTESSWKPLRPHRRKLFASDWWRLFPENDGRRKLTWHGRFSKKVPLIATNFYSTGEDVVANPRPEESVTEHLKNVIIKFNASEHAWVSQEISKGSDLMDLLLKDTHAGWALNEGGPWPGIKEQENWQQHIDELVGDELVRQHPFYEPFRPAGLYDPAAGSEKANDPDLQYRLLATAIPAKSFAVAANAVNDFNELGKNYDMMIMKTDAAWPRGNDEKGARWLHSDFRNVALCYVQRMYYKMIDLEDLDD